MAVLQLLLHILFDQMHRHVAGAFDDRLHVVFPCDFSQFAQRLQLRELRSIIRIGDTARTQAVTE
ncbi:hypothetical protein D3C87_2088460 [compost metagenome]